MTTEVSWFMVLVSLFIGVGIIFVGGVLWFFLEKMTGALTQMVGMFKDNL